MIRLITALADPMPHRDVRHAAAGMLAFSLMSLTTALLYVWIRADLGGPGLLPILAASILALVTMALWMIGLVIRREGMIQTFLPAALIVFASLVVLPAFWFIPFGRILLTGLVLAILGLAFLPLRASLMQMSRMQYLMLVAFGIFCGIGFPLWQNSYTYSHVFGPEMAMTGLQHADPIFHAALAEMILQFGRVSTGLDGLVSTPYHVLSHAWIGLTGRLLGITTLEAYMIVPAVMGVPLLLFALCAASSQLTLHTEQEVDNSSLAVLLPVLLLLMLNIWDWGSYVASESYLHALIGFLFGLAALVDLARHNSKDWLSPVLCVGLTLLLMASKLSVGQIFACGAFWAFFRQREARLQVAALWGVLLALLALGFMVLTASSAHTVFSALDPWHFVRAYPDGAWASVFSCTAGLGIAAGLWALRKKHWHIPTETIGVLIIAAAAPGLLLRIGGGSAYYFIHVGSMAALVLAAGLLLTLPLKQHKLADGLVLAAFLASLVAYFSSTSNRNAWTTIEARAGQLIERLKSYPGGDIVPSNKSAFQQPIPAFRTMDVPASLKKSFGADLVAAHTLVPPTSTGKALLFVPPHNITFWRRNSICRNMPIHVPAITGMPMLLGLPPREDACDLNIFYGYPDYPQSQSFSRTLDDAAICELVRQRGFSDAVILPTMKEPRWIPCSRPGG